MKRKTTIKKEHVLLLFNYFSNIENNEFSKNFIAFYIRNRKILEIEKEIIDKQFELTEDEYEYILKETNIINKYKKEKDGMYIIPENNIQEFENEINKLKSTNKNIYESIDKKNKDKQNELDTSLTIELFCIYFDDIPNTINNKIFEILNQYELIIYEKK